MLEKEAYGKLKKMCNTLEDIRKLLMMQSMVLTLSVHNGLDDTDKETTYNDMLRNITDMNK